MTEEEKPEEKKPDEAPQPEEGGASQGEDLVEKAEQAADRLEKLNDNLNKNLSRLERLRVEKTLGGNADAGQRQEPTQEEKEIASAKKLLEGTGFEDMFDAPKE